MELYTYRLTYNSPDTSGTFNIQDVIENFESLIWTERYYGDSEVEITLPLDVDLIHKFPLGIFLGIEESPELMIVETISIENNRLKINGISILSWLNNRFVRYDQKHKIQEYTFQDISPGEIIWQLLFDMTNPNSAVLNVGDTDISGDYLSKLQIPEIMLYDFDDSDPDAIISVSYGPLYDAMREIATSYQIGMQIVFQNKVNPDAEKPLGFRSYKGLNKTRTQDPTQPQNPIVRFSAELNSLENIQQLQSQSVYKTIAFAFAPNLDTDLGDLTGPHSGVAYVEGTGEKNTFYGFNCRAVQVFADDLSNFADPSDDDIALLGDALGGIAKNALESAVLIEAADGDITPTGMFQYGRDYNLGDIVEIQGAGGIFSAIRVTEHIISEDSSGEKQTVTKTSDNEVGLS